MKKSNNRNQTRTKNKNPPNLPLLPKHLLLPPPLPSLLQRNEQHVPQKRNKKKLTMTVMKRKNKKRKLRVLPLPSLPRRNE
jgi:hypothetical protein